MGFEKDKNEVDKIIDMVNGAKTDILAVALGSPKGEKFYSIFVNDWMRHFQFLLVLLLILKPAMLNERQNGWQITDLNGCLESRKIPEDC